jgi:hypothetical protein
MRLGKLGLEVSDRFTLPAIEIRILSKIQACCDSSHFLELFEQEYQELLISELLIAAMEKDDLSVRRLAKAAGVSPTIIQELKSGKRTLFLDYKAANDKALLTALIMNNPSLGLNAYCKCLAFQRPWKG